MAKDDINAPGLPHIDEFFLFLTTQNYSEKTIYNYERDLATFSLFLASGLPSSPLKFSGVTKKIINEYKAYLASRDRLTPGSQEEATTKLSGGSMNRMLSSLRSYLKYLAEMDYKIPVVPDTIKMVKTDKKHAKVAEFEDLVDLIEAPSTLEKKEKVALRNRAVLEVLFSTGMRISELVSLNRIDIDGSGKIFIKGKGRKERFVYLTPRAQVHLENYLKTRKDVSVALFVPYRGLDAGHKDKRLSVKYIQAKIKEYREKLKINVPTTAHSLRHGFATYIAEKGASPAAIQILLGHESLNTTTRYVHASDRFAEETHHKFHPLSKNSTLINESND